jgi:hypothetical protein
MVRLASAALAASGVSSRRSPDELQTRGASGTELNRTTSAETRRRSTAETTEAWYPLRISKPRPPGCRPGALPLS